MTSRTCPNCNGEGVKYKRTSHATVSFPRKCYRCMGTGEIDSHIGEELSLTVSFGNENWEFKAIIHCSENIDELKLQQNDFYRKKRTDKNIPSFPHHEVLVYLDSELQYAKRIWNNEEQIIPLHIHYSDEPERLPFMCWTGDLPTEDDAIASWELWCLGSVWSLRQFWDYHEKIGFENLLEELGWNQSKFIDHLGSIGIKIVNKNY